MFNTVVSYAKKKRTWAALAAVGLAGSKIVTGDWGGGFQTLLVFFGG